MGGFNDMGIDLIATNTRGKYAVQIKRWKREVGMDAIRAAVAGRAHFQCDRAFVITNNYFTTRAKLLAKSNDCRLIDRDELAKQLNNFNTVK